MFRILKERLHQKYRTLDYPRVQPQLSPRFLGRPSIVPGPCDTACHACLKACPTGALELRADGPVLDMGRCLFCGACRDACPQGKISFTGEHRLAVRTREELLVTGAAAPAPEQRGATAASPDAPEKSPRDLRLFRRSLKLRQVSAAGCNACEADCNVLGTPVYDLGRFGIDFVASPRHADGLVVTGPVSENMRQALLDTYEAMPDPRVVVAVGACAISGGLFQDKHECRGGATTLLPVDIYVPGCPPNPWTILDALLMLTGK